LDFLLYTLFRLKSVEKTNASLSPFLKRPRINLSQSDYIRNDDLSVKKTLEDAKSRVLKQNEPLLLTHSMRQDDKTFNITCPSPA